MRYLLNFVYLMLSACTLPWLLDAAIRKGKYREGWGAKLLGRVPPRSSSRPCIWFHAVSVGEVNLLRPVIAQLRQDAPACDCVISTTTRTGYALARKLYAEDHVCYCPLDFSWAVGEAVRRLRPDLLVLAELEIWPNLIGAARRAGARIAVINGRLGDRSFRGYRRIRPLIRRVLREIDLIAAQNPRYARRFRALGAARQAVHVTGSVKFDGAETRRDNPVTCRLRQLWDVADESRVFLAGSTQAPEEQLAIEAFRAVAEQHPQWRLILVPRHPERFDEVAALLDRSGLTWQRRSQLDPSAASPRARAAVLLVDAVGELGAWWGLATAGFVGGSLVPRGGQNMIEPAAYGVAVCFGPLTANFRDIVALLLERQAAHVVANGSQLTDFLLRCASTPEFARQLGHHAQETVLSQQGAVRKTVRKLLPLLGPPGENPSRKVA